ICEVCVNSWKNKKAGWHTFSVRCFFLCPGAAARFARLPRYGRVALSARVFTFFEKNFLFLSSKSFALRDCRFSSK
ncbi:MAG: hypothetical protein IJW12_05310, partial [Opitutales bacterium]|nr:hypothetical protein [Opitutales bacterium]